MAETTTEKSYYQKLLDNANANISASLPTAAATDDQMFARYLDRYKAMGQTAMRDTIGQASALTGGYANSYAQNVGQQAYDEYIKGANDQMLDYAMQSKQLALQQDEYANNLASAEYARQLEAANMGAAYGDFSMFADIYGQDKADAWKAMWNKMNPTLAGTSAVGGGGGYYSAPTTIDYNKANQIIKDINAMGYQYQGEALDTAATMVDNTTWNYIKSQIK